MKRLVWLLIGLIGSMAVIHVNAFAEQGGPSSMKKEAILLVTFGSSAPGPSCIVYW